MMAVGVGMFVVLGDILELFVAQFTVEGTEHGRYLVLNGSLPCDKLL
jgi:hypothetical protein